MLLQPPRVLPVTHLSASSVSLWLKCRLRWRRRYIEQQLEQLSAAALLGRAIGAAERDSWGNQIETGERYSTPVVLDAFNDAWQLAIDTEGHRVDWEDERPGRIKDSGYRVLPLYHQLVAPTVTPIAVERAFSIVMPGVEWTVDGYMDVETDDRIPDLKARSRSKGPVSQADADGDLQAGTYLAARRAEGNPAAGFDFHSLVRAAKGVAPAPRDVLVTPTERTDTQLDQVIDLYYRVAAEIDWCLQYDVWTPPPAGVWWCSQRWCGFWQDCEYGGLHQRPNGHAPRPARRLADGHVHEAVLATIRKSGAQAGTTTAQKVGAHLGISTRSAAARLQQQPDVHSERPTAPKGRGKDKVTRELSGPLVYRLQTTPTEGEKEPVT